MQKIKALKYTYPHILFGGWGVGRVPHPANCLLTPSSVQGTRQYCGQSLGHFLAIYALQPIKLSPWFLTHIPLLWNIRWVSLLLSYFFEQKLRLFPIYPICLEIFIIYLRDKLIQFISNLFSLTGLLLSLKILNTMLRKNCGEVEALRDSKLYKKIIAASILDIYF